MAARLRRAPILALCREQARRPPAAPAVGVSRVLVSRRRKAGDAELQCVSPLRLEAAAQLDQGLVEAVALHDPGFGQFAIDAERKRITRHASSFPVLPTRSASPPGARIRILISTYPNPSWMS